MSVTTSRRGASLLLAGATLAAGAALVLAPGAASADEPDPILTLKHDAQGTTVVKKTGSTLAIKPTTLTTHVNLVNGDLTGSLPIPSTTTEFKALGFLPVKATVNFIPVGEVTGNINLTETQALVVSTAKYTIQLSDVKVAGFPTFAGSNCKTVTPAVIPANTPAGEGFDLLEGGNLEGTYTLPSFANCGINTPLINALVPGAGNTVKIQVSNGIVVE
ncbi:hypothetical protein [Aeromicrobium fastidiosum]|uniref:Uncharacterized protein n=1 Tax=Aeromicrobium fastidiosum TaxID=52699 RepID=A0A641AQD3_9ACTN|nr:hypothetical protein [Aeromicrobium fastidiosum]KAA1380139.1 hypothetical protein ESP62_002750 [Aeromicrobium fastidiosum]MBP2389674.1 hypothetical protein [Aeromicrobium fastidiosum]